jgi:hypothetical protein
VIGLLHWLHLMVVLMVIVVLKDAQVVIVVLMRVPANGLCWVLSRFDTLLHILN